MITVRELDEYIKDKQYRQINSVLVWQDSSIVLEKYYNGYNKDSRNVIRSISKSILSICTGICLDKGLIKSLDEPIYKYLEVFSEGIHPYHRAITIKHLLTMTSGIYWIGGVHYHCPQLSILRRSSNWVEHIAEIDVVNVPGDKFNYSEFDIILLTAVLEKAINGDVFDFINKNLYKPLNISSGRWYKSKCGVYYSCAEAGEGNGGENERKSNLTANEMLRLGQLFLKNGMYNGKQIVSEKYIIEAITESKQNSNYGYLWWIREEYYAARGFGGQKITVIPKKNMIIIIQATPTSRGKEYDDVLDLIKF